MKQWMTGMLTLAMALSLAACGSGQQTQQPQEPKQDPAPAAEQEAQLPTEMQTRTLEYNLEGEMVQVPATQYVGDGYTIYIPDEGWVMETGREDGFAKVSWEASLNDDAELEIIRLTGKNLQEAQAWVRAEADDYDLLEDKRGGLGGQDPEDGDLLEVTFHESGEDVYAVLRSYPAEAAEGFGVTLNVMADTFELTE